MPKRRREGAGDSWHESPDKWYGTTVEHWKATTDVLGGYSEVDQADAAGSLAWLARLGWDDGASPRPGTRALDCGAGVGRVSEGVLLRVCETVDLVEVSPPLLERARERLAPFGARRVNFILASLRDFAPDSRTYDLVWMQWVLGHLTDPDVVLLLQRCRAALAHGGCLVVKDNNAVPSECRAAQGRGKYKLDAANGAVIRTHNHLRALFRRAGLRCDRFELQRGFPAELYAVRSYHLVDASSPQ